MKRPLILLACVVACAGAYVAGGSPALAAARAPGQQASAGPSGIGMARIAPGDPKTRSDAGLYAKAMKSSDWTRTPDGLLYKSCFHQVPPDATLIPDKNEIVFNDGTVQTFASCPYPRLLNPHQAASNAPAPAPAAPGTNGWMQASWWNAPTGLGYLSTGYAVPTAPTVSGATDYIFSSFEPSNGSAIIQPVVGYGYTSYNNSTYGSGTIGGNFLWESSYYVWGNNAAAGYLYKVTALDTINGTMSASGCGSGEGGCTWTIHTKDVNSGYDSTLTVESDPKYDTVQGGVLESYGANGCNMLFANGHAVFRNIVVKNESGGQLTPSFVHEVWDQECSMHMNITSTAADIIWSP